MVPTIDNLSLRGWRGAEPTMRAGSIIKKGELWGQEPGLWGLLLCEFEEGFTSTRSHMAPPKGQPPLIAIAEMQVRGYQIQERGD